MNFRKWIYFTLVELRGLPLRTHYERYLREYEEGISPETTSNLLIRLLEHCQTSVPYYRDIMKKIDGSFYADPFAYLEKLPILSRNDLRIHFNELKSDDLEKRKWFTNTTSGSTGQPAIFIQDWAFSAQAGSVTLLFSKLAGGEIGDPEIYLWGSVRDISEGNEGWRSKVIKLICNTTYLDAFRISSRQMREFVRIINAKKPKLIVAYSGELYELSKFAEDENLEIKPPVAVITSADMLYPYMREKIEQVMQCKLYNRYGSREVGDVACEIPKLDGFWVAPWGNYVEIVDENGEQVEEGKNGEILITSLTNFAMPLLRYRIGDRGSLSPGSSENPHGQVLQEIVGRACDVLRNENGELIDSGNFMALLYFREWIIKFQVVQKNYSRIIYRIVKHGDEDVCNELSEIILKTRTILGNSCEVEFEFVEDIVTTDSGKYRYVISEIP